MRGSIFKTVAVTALVTALAVSALAFFVAPRLMNPTSPMDNMSNAMYSGPAQPDSYANSTNSSYTEQRSYAQPQLTRRSSASRTVSSTNRQYVRTISDERVVRKHRSTGKSVAIVAGSAGAGAAIGALAGGGKGAAIGALSGGAAGLIYDRLTANK